MYDAVISAAQATAHKDYPRVGATVPLDTVSSPGAYVCNWSGHLMRVPESDSPPNGGSRLNLIGAEPLMVTKISADPELPLSKARGLSWCFGISARF